MLTWTQELSIKDVDYSVCRARTCFYSTQMLSGLAADLLYTDSLLPTTNPADNIEDGH